MKLNKFQEKFLLEVGKCSNDCVRTIGRRIYATDLSCYITRDMLIKNNLIYLDIYKGKEVARPTKRGTKLIREIIAGM